ncbi:MAG: rhodanese-like domain-containing protein [Candidatus Eisenbacteria bacterium]|nr:rhodanese-like domain-containing protein [Candidatus Eisenbacteria bacterium]
MLLKSFFVPNIAHSSYLLAGSETCAIIDPQRDVAVYLDVARDLGVRITHVLETHLHADFISGHLDLAEATGAVIYAPRAGDCAFAHEGVAGGDVIRLEDMSLEVMETPGHTPEHVSYVTRDLSRGDSAVGVFCGDTLFVGDVGRPDLFPGRARELAGALQVSLARLLALPDFCEVYPAHGAGSLCGRDMAAKLQSTIGYERRHNPALQIADRDEFIRSLTTDMPAAPDHFARCSDINRQGPVRVSELSPPVPLAPTEFREPMRRGGAELDVRDYDAFGALHVPGAISIPMSGNLPVFAGWIIPADAEILLVAADDMAVEDAVIWLRRVGHDRAVGYLDGGMHSWAAAGLSTERVPQISARELRKDVSGDGQRLVLDVRSADEFQHAASRIPGSINIPATQVRTRCGELPKDRKIVVVCGSGPRSSMAASLLQRAGFSRVCNVAGGMEGFKAAGEVME